MLRSKNPVTLKSIATQLGVHVSTVSRVLNGDPASVEKAASLEVVERIRRLASTLHYRPNEQAISLKTRRSHEIGVLMPRLSDIVIATVYEGIDEAADDAGYVAFVAHTQDNFEKQRIRGERALRRHVAGMIIGDAHVDNSDAWLATLKERDIPYVLVGRGLSGHLSATCDDRLGGRLAAQHLYELGHRDVAVLAGERHAPNAATRTRGFIEFYQERGIDITPRRVLNSPFDTMSGRQLGELLLANRPYPTAIFASNDFLAIGVMGVIRDVGLQVGRDIAIVGYNDTPLASELPIPLTSVHMPMNRLGRESVRLLLESVAGSATASVCLAPFLQIRASSSGQFCRVEAS